MDQPPEFDSFVARYEGCILPLEAVKEAIAYAASGPPEIEADRRGEGRVMEATGMNDPDYKRGGKYKLLSPQERAELGLCGRRR